MDKIKLPQNRGYLISAIGALVALLAFLLLPYVVITLKTVASSSSSTVYSTSLTVNATALTQSSDSGLGLFYHAFLTQSQGVLWLMPILSLLALAVTGLVLYRDLPFGKAVNAPVAAQKQWVNYGLIAIAALGVLIQIITIANLGGQIQNSINASNSSGSSSLTTVSTAGHIGFWLYLLGMAAVAGGAIFLLVQTNKQSQAIPAANMSAVPPIQPWQSPTPTPTPPNFNPNPYAQQYTTGSQQDWSQPSQTPPAYPAQQPPAYPAQQQWPPSSNQPQPPYSQGQ